MKTDEVRIKKVVPKNVIAVDGVEYPREKCRKIAGQYYLLGSIDKKDSGHVIKVGEIYYRIGKFAINPQYLWDDASNKYQPIGFLSPYLISLNPLVQGYTSAKLNAINLHNYGEVYINESVESFIQKNNLSYHIDPQRGSVCWANLTTKQIDAMIQDLQQRNHKKIHYREYPTEIYNIAEYPKEFMKPPKGTFAKSAFDRFIKNYSFGIEIETSGGHFPEIALSTFGLVPLKDGSITGHEYTTVPLNYKGLSHGVNYIKQLFDQMSKTTVANQQCSLHYHFGNIPKTKEFVVALWHLYSRLQSELDDIMPPYKRNLRYLAQKPGGPKDHCARIMNLDIKKGTDENFKKILKFLNEGDIPDLQSNGIYRHSREGRAKWDYESRYVSLNLIPLLFDKKGTAEFRLHSGTVNSYKAINWLFICIAILEFAKEKQDLIFANKEKVILNDVIEFVFDDDTAEGDFLVRYLTEYISSRKETNYNINIEDRHLGVGTEFRTDNFYEFKLGGMDLFNYTTK